MGAVSVDGKEASSIQSVEEMAGRFSSELITFIPQWRQTLIEEPDQLANLEARVHGAFARGADLLVAGLIAVAMQQTTFEQASEQTRQNFATPLTRGRQRTIGMRLLGGLLIWVSSLYCAPSSRRSTREKRSGLYVELAQFGCGKGVSPALQSRIARQAALAPSYQFAHQELERSGVTLDVKTVCRVTEQCGESLLELRTHQRRLFHEGNLTATSELHQQRVTVQIDGGRVKIRGSLREKTPCGEETHAEGVGIEDGPGRSQKQPVKTYDSDWREPKVVTIFVHDEHGRMKKNTRSTIDGTFLGPDAIAELTAMHLHRLGAAQALSVTFVADGAPWIWDRIAGIVELANLGDVKIHQVLDNCHAVHHISLALLAFGLNKEERMPLYREHRTLLRNGQWRRVVEELTSLATENLTGEELAKMETEIAYLKKHGEAGRLSYPHFVRLGIPLGSGAIESSIRRVINLRLKNNGMFWKEKNAEKMLQIRALVISDRWDARLQEMREHRRCHPNTDWRWSPQSLSKKVEGNDQRAKKPLKQGENARA